MVDQNDQCKHGRCKDHNPDMRKVNNGDRFDPHPKPFSKRWQRVNKHEDCNGMIMERRIHVKLRRCSRCSREEEQVVGTVAYCSCCGYHREHEWPFSNYILLLAVMILVAFGLFSVIASIQS